MTKNKFGFVYIATTTIFSEKGLYKVGSTNDVARRLRELSARSSSPEEFYFPYYFRCEDLKSAQILEKSVHRSLDEDHLRYRSNREFFQTGTPLPIVRCVIETAKYLEMPIISGEHAEFADLLDQEPSCPLPADRLMELDDVARKAYRRAARDLTELLFTFLANLPSICEQDTTDNEQVHKNLLGIVTGIKYRVDGSLHTEYIENGVPLDQVFFEAVDFIYGHESVKVFRSVLLDWQDSARQDDLLSCQPKDLRQLKDELRKHASKMELTNR